MKSSLARALLTLAAAILAAASANGAVITMLHNFEAVTGTTNTEGAYPLSTLVSSGSTLYGVCWGGGTGGNGAVYKINTDGTGFTNLHSFSSGIGNLPNVTNSDGAGPQGNLALCENTLYGTTIVGGAAGNGTLFRINTDGTGFTNLHIFTSKSNANATNGDGAVPYAGLVVAGNTLYGAASLGGPSGEGTIFKMNTDGTGFETMYNFNTTGAGSNNFGGVQPYANLLLSGNTLYGGTFKGGSQGLGTIFTINTDGSDFNVVYNFTNMFGPKQDLVLGGNTLYGTVGYPLPPYPDCVFKLNTDGTGFSILASGGVFTSGNLLLSGSMLYGAQPSPPFMAYKVNVDGSGLTNFISLPSGQHGGFVQSGGTLYGTTEDGGAAGTGTVFALTINPTLNIALVAGKAVLSWNDPTFSLLTTTNLAVNFTTVSGAASPFTNTLTGTRLFFRLQSNQ